MNDARRQPRRIAVIGGGISGLAAAHRLVERDPSCRLTLLEARSRLGGVLATVHQQGYQVEQSADNFITTVPWGLELCRRLGLGDQLIQTNPTHRRTYVVRRGRLHRLPDGFLMMAPTRLWPLAVTPILSPWGKLRAACEYFIPPRKDPADESMAGFVRRRLGREAFDRLVEPLVGAVYAADMEKLSVDATLSRFREMEQTHGSLIRAMRRQRKARPKAGTESGARYSMFVTLRDGLSSLIDAIAERLPQDAVLLETSVQRIERAGDGWRVVVQAVPKDVPEPGAAEQTLDFDALILATPSTTAARLLEPIDAELAADLRRITHSGTAIVSLGYDRRQIGHPLDGMGAVVPAIENSPILACSFSSQKYAHRAPQGKVLLRVFAGGARRPELAKMDEQQLLPLVAAECDRLLHIRGKPEYCNTARWPGTMPQYHVGHNDLVSRIEGRVSRIAALGLAGNAYHGVGIPDCIHGGQQAAEQVLAEKGA
ncbi:MAG: protoporphyrinogen oxidase [Pirellulales bacterium]|nr:protoporphyrinogen oxidase [Pirellulales bacterium]